MKRFLSLRNLESVDARRTKYDLVIVAAGFEQRGRHFAETISPTGALKIAIGFGSQKVLSFKANLKALRRMEFEYHEIADGDFSNFIDDQLQRSERDKGQTLRLAVDISSFSRFRIALILEHVAERSAVRPITVDFFYSLAKFSRPKKTLGLINNCGAVSSGFAGWSANPERALSVIVGLGYEPEKAVGALEYIEPGLTWLLIPIGKDRRYEDALLKANKTLIESTPHERILRYVVTDPMNTFSLLRSISGGLIDSTRPIFLPFGPKIFALNTMLVSLTLQDSISVWRVSSGENEAPHQRRPEGSIISMQVGFGLERNSQQN